MRLSADESDSGYSKWWSLGHRRHYVDVFLDGDLIQGVVTADDVEGLAVVYAHDHDGRVVPIDGKPLKRTLRGKVKIVVPPLRALT